jgi:hypothetical protein
MKRMVTFLLIFLMLSSTITPAVLAGEGNKNRLDDDISDYQEDLLELNEKIAKIYQEINEGKKGKETYPHAVKAAKETAEMIGKTNELAILMSEAGFETRTTSLGGQLEDIAIYGLSSDVRGNLIQMGYSSEDIDAMERKITEYNAYLYRISTEGFTPEEIQSMKDAGYTDSDIENLENAISQRYSAEYGAAEQLNASKSELYQVQTTLSILSLKLLMDSSKEKGKISQKQFEHLGKLEKKLIEDIDKLDEKKKWNHIKDDGKELYKYSEMLIKKSDNASEFSVDYFIGMQMYLAAVTAKEGDEEFALGVINTYKLALEDLANKRAVEDDSSDDESSDDDPEDNKKSWKRKVKVESFIRPLTNSLTFETYKIGSLIDSFISKFSIPSVYALPQIIGQVDELDETNNVVETTINVYWPEGAFSEMPPVFVLGPVFAGSGGVATVIEGAVAVTTWEIILLAAFVVVAGYIIINEASNPTVYKYPEERRDLTGGKYMIIKRSYKLNGDVSVIVVIYDIDGNQLSVFHIVYGGNGIIKHGPERKLESNDPTQELPNQNYFPDLYPPLGF